MKSQETGKTIMFPSFLGGSFSKVKNTNIDWSRFILQSALRIEWKCEMENYGLLCAYMEVKVSLNVGPQNPWLPKFVSYIFSSTVENISFILMLLHFLINILYFCLGI